MEIKSLFLGFIFAVGIFAMKNGTGLFYCLSSRRTVQEKLVILASNAFLYLTMFAASVYALRRIDLLDHFNLIEKLLKSGMLVHGFVSAGLMAWGIWLLKKREAKVGVSRGWLALVIPCPVCLTVIGMTLFFLLSFFPGAFFTVITVAYLLFTGISFATAAALTFWGRFNRVHANAILAAAMMMMGAYFFLSTAFMPFFQELEQVYRLAAGKKSSLAGDWRQWLLIGSAAVIFVVVGFYQKQKAMRR